MQKILCHRDFGPHHGVYECLVHGTVEVYNYGVLTSRMTFREYDLYVQHLVTIIV
jgi:hypothetical protein